ncbi:MAG: PTS transporter subunit EIIC [Sulfurospirillum sp.]|nr:PTS transporter subunit EIIC [Sulfurospirillum sp.]
MAILVALLFFSKTPQQKKIANLSLPPSIFNINEPIMFGMPIIFSPIFFLP